MKKNEILYKGDNVESLWGALGYMPLMPILTMSIDKSSIFLKVHGIRSLFIFILFPIVNLPIILSKLNIISTSNILYLFYFIFAVIFTFLMLIDYINCIHHAANGIYKKSILIDKLFLNIINLIIYNIYFSNDKK